MSSRRSSTNAREFTRESLPFTPILIGSQQIRSQSVALQSSPSRSTLPPSTLSVIDFSTSEIKFPSSSSQLSLKMHDLPPKISIIENSDYDEVLSIVTDQEESDTTLPLLPQTNDRLPQTRHSKFKYLKVVPSIFLALFLNVLDALSYGIIIFPVSAFIPDSATHAGISMFLVSTIISQLVFSLNGSGLRGAVGSMMIEVMPFLYSMTRIISETMNETNDRAILATIMFCYASSTILTGLVFFILGKYKCGNIIQFFPRHILVGCIGGIGMFLFATAVEVTSGIKLEWNLSTIKSLFGFHPLKIWISSLLIAVSLKILQTRITHPLFVPIFYSTLPVVFFSITTLWGYSIIELRDLGWLLNLKPVDNVPFYQFYSYFDFGNMDALSILACVPTMIALSLFGVLHVPINVPALALSTNQEVDLNRELVAHGISNVLSGLFGSLQNYIVYQHAIFSST